MVDHCTKLAHGAIYKTVQEPNARVLARNAKASYGLRCSILAKPKRKLSICDIDCMLGHAI